MHSLVYYSTIFSSAALNKKWGGHYLDHCELVDDYSTLYQTALLYTDVYGRRRLRVHNLSLNCSSKSTGAVRLILSSISSPRAVSYSFI